MWCIPFWVLAADTTGINSAAQIALPFERAAALTALLEKADSKELGAYFVQAQKLSPAVRREFKSQILRYWAAEDAPSALKACLSQEAAFLQRNDIRELFRSWGESDPQAAYATILTYQGKSPATHMVTGFFEGYAQRNPQEAFFFLLKQRREHPDPLLYRSGSTESVLRKWAEKDPQTAFQTLASLSKDEREQLSLYTMLSTWFAEDPKACLKAISVFPPEELRNVLASLIPENVTRETFALLLPVIQKNMGRNNPWLLSRLFSNFGKENLPFALECAYKLQNTPEGKTVLAAVFSVWGRTDFGTAMQEALKIEDPRLRSEVLESLWRSKINSGDDEKDIKAMLAIPDQSVRQKLIQEKMRNCLYSEKDIGPLMKQISDLKMQRDLLSSMVHTREGYWCGFSISDRKAAESLRDWALILPPGQARMQLLQSVFNTNARMEDLQWVSEHLPPGEANALYRNLLEYSNSDTKKLLTVENFNALPEGNLRDFFMSGLVRELAKQSPEDARAFLVALPQDQSRDKAYANYVNGLLDSNQIPATMAALQNMPEGYQPGDFFYQQLAYQLAKKNSSEAIAWALALTDKDAQTEAFCGIASGWDKNHAGEFLAQIGALENGEAKNRAMRHFISSWGFEDPEAAAGWVKNNVAANPETTKEGVGGFFSYWVSQDPMAATQWLQTLPEGSTRTQAIASMVYTNEAIKSPEGVQAWIFAIPVESGEKNRRQELMTNLIVRLAKEYPEKAQALLANPQLTQAEREAGQKALSNAK